MKSIKQISEVTGELLGPVCILPYQITRMLTTMQHLARVSDKYKELLAYSFIRCFKVKGYQKCPLGDDYDDFVASIYAVTPGNRAASVISNIGPATLRASIPPTPPKKQQNNVNSNDDNIEDDDDPPSSDNGDIEEIERSVYWQGVGTTSDGLRISRAGLSRSMPSDASLVSSTSTQAAVDAQILRELGDYGFEIEQHTSSATAENLFAQQLLHEASQPTPSPPAASSIEVPAGSIIDLTWEDDEDSNNTIPSTGSQSTAIKFDDQEEDEECIEVAVGVRKHVPLSLRSKSLSEPMDTPTRAPKRKMATR